METLLFISFLDMFLPRKNNGVTPLLIILLIGGWLLEIFANRVQFGALGNLLISLTPDLLFVMIMYKGKVGKKIFLLVVFSGIIIACQAVVLVGCSFIAVNAWNINGTYSWHIFIRDVLYLLLFVTAIIFTERFRKVEKIPLQNRYWIQLFSMPLISFLIIFLTFPFYLDAPPVHQPYLLSISGLLLILNLSIFFIYRGICQYCLLAAENLHLKKCQEKSKKFSLQTLEAATAQKAMFHDYRKNIILLNQLLRRNRIKAAEELITSLVGIIENCKFENYTHNFVIDAALSNVNTEGVALRVNGYLPEELPFDTGDISSIVGNALDNAKNAVIVSGGEIRIGFEYKDQVLKILCENTVPDGYPSCREDGMGLKIIKATAEKYFGEMIVQRRDGVFSIYIQMSQV